MKTQNPTLLQGINQKEWNQLLVQVEETVATDMHLSTPKNSFGAVDYWKLQRNRRNRITRRFLFA